MMQRILTALLLALVSFTACSEEESPSAIIRVTLGDPPHAVTGKFAASTEQATLTSYDFLRHVDRTIGLAKVWGIPAEKATAKLRRAIVVQAGKKPGLFVVKAKSLGHDLSVKVLNELCEYYCSFAKERHLSESSDGGPPQAIHVTIVKLAK